MAKTELLTVRVTQAELDLLREVSAKLHLTMSQYVRKALIDTAHAINEKPENLPQVFNSTAHQLVSSLTMKAEKKHD